jgi:hypothetical protein
MMISTIIREYIFNEMGAPKVISCDAQLEEYVSALLELDQHSELTEAEENFAELLILLIEAYVARRDLVRSGSPLEDLKELLSADELWQKN